MIFKFWGTRGSIAAPGERTVRYGGNTTCVTVSTDNSPEGLVIIDAGTGVRALGDEILRMCRPSKIRMIFTHSHWDHIQGFPFFMPAYQADFELEIYGWGNSSWPIKESLLNLMDSRNFPIALTSLQAKLNFRAFRDKLDLSGLAFTTLVLNHPGSGIGLRISDEYGKSLCFVSDHELSRQPYIGYSFEQTVDFCYGAEVLVHDAQYIREELPVRMGWGHSAVEEAYDLARKAEVRQLILFHHDPNRSDDEIDSILLQLGKKSRRGMEIKAAFEGMEVRI